MTDTAKQTARSLGLKVDKLGRPFAVRFPESLQNKLLKVSETTGVSMQNLIREGAMRIITDYEQAFAKMERKQKAQAKKEEQ